MNSGYQPKRPTGSDPEACYQQWVFDQIHSLQPRNTNTVRVGRRDSKGIEYIAAAGGSGGTSIQQCVITELDNANYIGVTPFDILTGDLAGTQFYCAKAISGRMPASEVIDGQTITYSDYGAGALPSGNGDNTRLATFAVGLTEWQVMHRRYMLWSDDLPDGSDITQFLLLVSTLQNTIGVTDPDDNQVRYIEISPTREWAYSNYLNGGNS